MTCFFNAFGYLFAMVLEMVFDGFGHVFCFRYGLWIIMVYGYGFDIVFGYNFGYF